ncbi:MAG: Gfo/Idh/MocA family oxidoreductase [Pirellula sp.]|nr:Gfo/Idh/MocA family oxidoreductase [Pirellula sp.]
MSNPTSSKLRIAVIGGGHLGRIHAKLLASRDDVALVAICDPSEAARQVIESQLGLPTRSDYESLSNQIDAAVVVTPTVLHHRIGRWCLEQGIHTLIEKPIAASPREADDLIHCADQHRCVLQVGHVERFNAVWKAASEAIEPCAILHIDARREGVYTGRSTDIGIVLDLMIHDIDLILSLIQQPVDSIRAMGRSVLGEHEDFAIADLVFRNGTTAHLRASRLSPTPVRAMELHAEDRWVSVNFGASTCSVTRPTEAVASREIQADALPASERLKVKDEMFTRWLEQSELKPVAVNAISEEHTDFIDAIRQERSPIVSGRDGAQALQIACEIAHQISSQSQVIGGVIPASKLAAARRRAG